MDETNDMDADNKINTIREKYGTPAHYYGDIVRQLFIAGAIVMLATLAFLTSRLPTSPFISISIIVVLASAAGFLSPRGKSMIIVDFFISMLGVVVFEYYAVDAYTKYSGTDALFLVNQVLAIIFLVALYYSAKTARAVLTGE